MTTFRLELNDAVLEWIRTSDRVKADLLRRAKRIRNGCGDGYVLEVEETVTRARITIYPKTYAAAVDNAENNTLLRNLDRGR